MAEYIINPSEHEIKQVLMTMLGESDRGRVLVGTSLIEWQMAQLLKVTFLSRHSEYTAELKKQIDIVLDPLSEKSILGAAAPRARMCRLLGLISEETHTLLKKFLRFRNEHFAHARNTASLSATDVARDLDNLIRAVPQEASALIKDEQTQLDKFAFLVMCLFFLLDPQYQNDQTGSQPSSS